MDALNRQTWKRTSSSSSSAGSSRNSHFQSSSSAAPQVQRNVGILGIEKRLAEQHQKTHESISQVSRNFYIKVSLHKFIC